MATQTSKAMPDADFLPKQVKEELINKRYRVSTVRIPHAFTKGRDVYETCIFDQGDGKRYPDSDVIARYDTEDEATKGHNIIAATIEFMIERN